MGHVKFYEPIAISYFEKYFESHGYDIKLEPCGLLIDEQNSRGFTRFLWYFRGKMQLRTQKYRPKRCLLCI